MTNPVDTAWAAGVLEGEGSFVRRSKNSCAISCEMTDLDILVRLQGLFGGSIYEVRKRKDHWKDCWVWRLNGANAVPVMRAILPFMGVRRTARIESLLDSFQSRVRSNEELAAHHAEIRRAYTAGEGSMRQLAKRFGTSAQTIHNAVHEVLAP